MAATPACRKPEPGEAALERRGPGTQPPAAITTTDVVCSKERFTGTVRIAYRQHPSGTAREITGLWYQIDAGGMANRHNANVRVLDSGALPHKESGAGDTAIQDGRPHPLASGYSRATGPITVAFTFDRPGSDTGCTQTLSTSADAAPAPVPGPLG